MLLNKLFDKSLKYKRNSPSLYRIQGSLANKDRRIISSIQPWSHALLNITSRPLTNITNIHSLGHKMKNNVSFTSLTTLHYKYNCHRHCLLRRQQQLNFSTRKYSSSSSVMSIDKSKRVLLPNDIIPKHHVLTLEPDLEKLTFQGELSITFQVKKPTKR